MIMDVACLEDVVLMVFWLNNSTHWTLNSIYMQNVLKPSQPNQIPTNRCW
jgi:hypothetical protein